MRTPISVADFLAEPDSVLKFDQRHEGACPCGVIVGQGFVVKFHYWRTGYEGCNCRHSGVHVLGTIERAVLRDIAKHAVKTNFWRRHTDWKLDWRLVSEEELREIVTAIDQRDTDDAMEIS